MVEPITINIRHLSQDVRIPQEQVQAAIDLLDVGFPVPFIARYRKGVTNNLSEESLRRIDEELRSARFLCERKLTILKTIESSGKLTPELDKNIREAKSVKRLEDLYLPFKPKRQNPAAAARENGLEPLALEILEGTLPAEKLDERAAEFINEDKQVRSVADVLLGTGHILADILSCKAELVHKARDILYQHGHLTGTKIETAGEAADAGKDGRRQTADGSREALGGVADPDEGESAVSDSNSDAVSDTGSDAVAACDKSENGSESGNESEGESEHGSRVEIFEPTAGLGEQETPLEEIDAIEADTDVVDGETADSRQQMAAEATEADAEGEETAEDEEATDEEAAEVVEGAGEAEGASENPLFPSAEEETQEVAALFQQLQEEQAEKGLPVVRSQNSIKKKKKAEAKKKQDEIKQRQREHFGRQFASYFNFSIKLRGVPAHHILALNRGERHKILQVAVKIDEAKMFESIKESFVPKDHPHADFLTGCLQDALHRGILPTLYREVRNDMTEYAEKNVIKIFGQNLRNLLLQRPLHQKRVLALDPSHKHGCKAVALDEFGNLLGHETIFVAQSKERRSSAEQALAEMIRRFNITIIAIGSGGGSRPVEELVAGVIETCFSEGHSTEGHSTEGHSTEGHSTKKHSADSDLVYAMVNKAGSIAYSTSPLAKEELPGEDPFVRAAISIGRRLQDPLSELVKTEPASLGLAMFLQDSRGKYVKQMLAEIVESCVNIVGVDLNRATPAMLTHIAGLNQMTARRIYEYRREHGQFRTREDLKKVPGINETAYTYAAGFLRISGGENPLDSTNIHPESYELAANILEKLGFSANDLRSSEKIKTITDKIATEKFGEFTLNLSSALNAPLDTVRDIVATFSKLGQEPKDTQLPVIFRKTTLKLENLTPGTELIGTILNVTDFGAFVDIGLPESGFIHVSQMATGYIQDAHEKVFPGNTVRLWVVEADIAKKRVSLSLLSPGTDKLPPRSADKRDQERSPRERAPRPPRQ